MRSLGLRSGVAGPVVVGGRIWGALVACSAAVEPLPRGTEYRIAAFAQLVSLAIESAETREELAASRARLVAAADEARRRIERDLHDGAQQRLAGAGLTLTMVRPGCARRRREREHAARERARGARRGLCELRDLARGLHPAILTDRGIEAAIRSLVQRAPVPVEFRRGARPAGRDDRGGRVLRRLRSADQRRQVRAGDAVSVSVRAWGDAGRDDRRRRRRRRRTRCAAPACAGSSTACRPSAAAWRSAARRGQGTRLRAELPTNVLGSLEPAAAVVA